MNYMVLLLVVFMFCHGGEASPDSLCSGLDVSNDPRIEARMLDGHWYTQQGLSSSRISNTIVYFQFQGSTEWHNDWNSTTRTCTFFKYEDQQQQSLENGPYSPCIKARQLLPCMEKIIICNFDCLKKTIADGTEFVFYMPTRNLLMCFRYPLDQVRNKQYCIGRPFVRVMTRTLDISREELSLVRMRLRRMGVNQKLDVINPRENGCSIPTQRGRRRKSKGYGRANNQW